MNFLTADEIRCWTDSLTILLVLSWQRLILVMVLLTFLLDLSRVKIRIFINTIQSKALNNRLFDSMTTGCFINTGDSIAKNE